MRLILILSFVVVISACAGVRSQTSNSVTHVVMVWFNESVTQQDIDAVALRTQALRAIPELLDVKVGKAIPSDRPIVDDSFDLGVVMTFDSAEAMNAYLVHPVHLNFVEQYLKGKAEKLVVYDF